MSEHVNALIIIGHGSRMAADAPHYAREDVEQGLGYIREGKKQWYNGEPITETDKINLYAGEAFLNLGRIAARTYLNEPISFIRNSNPFKFSVIDAINSRPVISRGQTLKYPVETSYYSTVIAENGLPQMYQKALLQDPLIKNELLAKWSIAQQIYEKRGSVTLPSYNIDEMTKGLSDLDMDEIAPDDITDSSYNLGGLIEHAGIETHLVDYPYYATFNANENATEMLYSAIEDLRLVRHAIQ